MLLHFIKTGVEYRATPLEIREKLTFSETELEQAMLALSKKNYINENIILSTCNRTEVFAVVEDKEKGKEAVADFLKDWFQLDESDLLPYLQFETDEKVVRHAYRLAAGMESMVLGETQILGQVRDVFLKAQQNQAAGKQLNELFRRVVTFGKRAHSETVIGQLAVSVSYVAVELSRKIFGDIRGKHAVILGAGEMGEASLKNLHGAGASEITIINRSFSKAEQLAERFHANAAPMDQLDQVLIEADILISSTGSDEVVLTKDRLAKLQEKRGKKPLILIDIAVPRDIEQSAGELEHVYLYDMDDLQSVKDENVEKRKKAAAYLEKEIEKELVSFNEWLDMLDVVPIIKALNEKSSRIQEKTLESIHRKIPDLDDRERKVLQKHMKSIITQLLEQPIKQVKEMRKSGQSDEVKTMFVHLFGLEDSLKDSLRR